MPEEQLTLELERDGIWLELDGKGQDWAFRFVLSPPEKERRGVEGSWEGLATRAVIQSLRLLESGALGSADSAQHLGL